MGKLIIVALLFISNLAQATPANIQDALKMCYNGCLLVYKAKVEADPNMSLTKLEKVEQEAVGCLCNCDLALEE